MNVPQVPDGDQMETDTDPKSLREHVVRGAGWLDEHFPGWEGKVDLSILDIQDGQTCICGQVVPKEMTGGESGWSAVTKSSEAATWKHGFCGNEHGDHWVKLIKERYDSGILSDSF